MLDRRAKKEMMTVVGLCILWYSTSSGNSVITKMLLNEFPYPMTVTMVQLLSITIYSGPFFNMMGIRKFVDMSWLYYLKIILPLAFGKFAVSVLTHVSIWKVPVSYAHTVKATMPLFSVVLSRIILKEKQTNSIYLSLVPIVTGVVIATLTELSFDLIGLICALLATLQMSLQNIFSKKALQDVGMHHLRLLHILGRLAFFLFIPIWVYFDFSTIISTHNALKTERMYYVLALLWTDGILNWLQNIFSFTIMSMVTSLTFAVANASKRIFIICCSLFFLGNPVTTYNFMGMLLAIFGMLLYNVAKYQQHQNKIKETILPLTRDPRTINNNFLRQYDNNKNGYMVNGYAKLTSLI